MLKIGSSITSLTLAVPLRQSHCGSPETDISKLMQTIKGGTAYLCNQQLDRKGAFWQKENFDHYVRNGKELQNIIEYIVQNPVKAGLCENWEDWPFTYWNGWR